MFSKVKNTKYPPKTKPVLVWDGECDFCNFWKSHWEKITGSTVQYKKYQEIAGHFKDIPISAFKKASHFIDLDGKVYSGPDSAYKSYQYANRKVWLHPLYTRNLLFRNLSDYVYNYIAKNRGFFYKVSKIFFGNEPQNLKPYWLIYLVAIIILIMVISAKI